MVAEKSALPVIPSEPSRQAVLFNPNSNARITLDTTGKVEEKTYVQIVLQAADGQDIDTITLEPQLNENQVLEQVKPQSGLQVTIDNSNDQSPVIHLNNAELGKSLKNGPLATLVLSGDTSEPLIIGGNLFLIDATLLSLNNNSLLLTDETN